MRIIGFVDYSLELSTPPEYLAHHISLQLLGWQGTVFAVAVTDVELSRAGLVFVDLPPSNENETRKCVEHFKAELRRERAEAYAEFGDEEDVRDDVS